MFSTDAGGRAEKRRGRAEGRGRRGGGRKSEPMDLNLPEQLSQNADNGNKDDDIDWEPAS